MVILASVTHRRPDVPSLQPCTGDLTHSKSLVVLAMLRCNLLQMGTGLRRLGRDFVLAGYVAVVVTLGRAIVVLSEPRGSAQYVRALRRINQGYGLAFIMLVLGILASAVFVVWIAHANVDGAEQIKIAKVATSIFAIQSLLFCLGLLAYVINELTLKFPNLVHPGLAGFAWEYPMIFGLLLAAFGYLMVFKSLEDRNSEVPDGAPTSEPSEFNEITH